MPCKLSEILLLSFIFNEYCSQFGIKMLIYYRLKKDMGKPSQDAMGVFHLYIAFICLSTVVVDVISKTKIGEFWTMAILSIISVITLLVDFVIPKGSYEWKVLLLLILAVTTGGNFKCVQYICYSQYILPLQNDRYKRMLFTVVVMRCLGELYGSITISFYSDIAIKDSIIDKDIFIIAHKIIGMIFIFSGYKVYQRRAKRKNHIFNFIRASYYAIKRNRLVKQVARGKAGSRELRAEHVIPQSDYDKIKMMYHAIPLYAPIVVILAFKEQKFTTFVLQTEAVTKKVADFNVHHLTILSFVPFFTLMVVLIFHGIVLPLGLKYGHNMGISQSRTLVAFFSLAVSFAAAAVVEIQIEGNRYPNLKAGYAKLLIFNTLPCEIRYEVQGVCSTQSPILPLSFQHSYHMHVYQNLERMITVRSSCFDKNIQESLYIRLNEYESYAYSILYNVTGNEKISYAELETLPKDFTNNETQPYLRGVYHIKKPIQINLIGKETFAFFLDPKEHEILPRLVPEDKYQLYVNGSKLLWELEFLSGGIYTIMVVTTQNNELLTQYLVTTKHTRSSILLLLPQIFFISISDGLVLAPGFIYCKSKVPPQWVELLVTLWFLAGFLGNILMTILFKYVFVARKLYSLMSAVIGITFSSSIVIALNYYKEDYKEKVKRFRDINYSQVGY